MSRQGLTEVWEVRINDYLASGEGAATWCEQHGVTPRQLYYWRRKLQVADQDQSKAEGTQWVPVQLADSTGDPAPMLVRVGVATIEVRSGFEPTLLVEVVRTLKALC